MSTLAARLSRLTPALTAKERAALVLRAQAAGEQVDPEVRRIADPDQRRAFDRLMGLGYVINRELGAVCQIIESHVDALDSVLYPLRLLNQAAGLLEEAEGAAKPANDDRNWRRKGDTTVPEFLRGVAEELRVETLRDLASIWRQVRALELVWDELASEFGGVDPVHPSLRAKTAALATRLRAIASELGGKRRLGEPDEVMLDQLRATAKEGFDHLGLAGVYE